MNRAWLKYLEVARINLRSRFAYLWDQLLSTIHLMLIMFVFVQLWKVTYAGSSTGGEIGGYRLNEMIWYLVGTEALILSLPRIDAIMADEVKGGDLAIRLNKPYNYLLFHYSGYVGEGLFRLATNLLIGGLTAYLLVGGFDFRWAAIPAMLVIYLVSQGLHFCYNACIGLAAFWLEEVAGLYFIFDRLKWILGGMLLPVEVYPDGVRRIVEVLPFRHMIAGPARLFVKWDPGAAFQLLSAQVVWVAALGALCWGIYRLGVRRVDVNGG